MAKDRKAFVFMYGGHPPTEEYYLHQSKPPAYHYAFCCPKCGEIWGRQVWLIPPLFRAFWFVPTPCPEHSGRGFIGSTMMHYHKNHLWSIFSGQDLRREFLHYTQNVGDLLCQN